MQSICRRRPTVLINHHHRIVIASQRKRNRARLLVVAAGLALTFSLWTVGLSQRASNDEELGKLMGTVYNVPNDLASGKPTVVILNERRGEQREIPVDDKGQFKTRVRAGVYKVYIMGIRDDATKALKHRIGPGDETMVNLDWIPDQIYCTASGERVSPTGLGTFDASKYHRPKFDSYNFDSVGREPINVVIEYCKKTSNRDVAQYTSTRLMSGGTIIFADNVSFDSKTSDATATNTNVTFVQHEKRLTRFVAGTEHIANFRSGAHFDMSGGSLAIQGQGSIAPAKANFNFYISKDTLSFYYTDPTGLVLKADRPDCSFITPGPKSASNTAVFGGSAIVTGNTPLLKSRTSRTVEFRVKVVDNGTKSKNRDSFIIEIPELGGYERSGRLVSGDIHILPKSVNASPDGTSKMSRRR